jgi:Flp pilus assembly protein CpaB
MVQFKMKGSIRNKIASLLFLCISLAIVFFIFQNVDRTRQVTRVPVLNKPVIYGQLITEEDIREIEIGIYNMPSKLLTKKSDIAGRYAASDLMADRYIYQEDLLAVKPATTIKEIIQQGAVAVETDLIKCVGGLPSAGDYVKVDIVYRGTDGGRAYVESPAELQRVKILAVKNPSGDYVEQAENKKESTAFSGSKDVKPGLIIFDASPVQELKLLAGAYSGVLHMVLLPQDQQGPDLHIPAAPAAPPEAEGEAPSESPQWFPPEASQP